LAECGVKIGIHYYKNAEAANDNLARVRERGSSGFIVHADVNEPEEIRQMMDRVKREFGTLDFFVSNARPEIPGFYKPPLEISVEQWQLAINSQATLSCRGARGDPPHGKRRKDHRYHARAGGADRELAALGRDGVGESGHGVTGALLCCCACPARHHRDSVSPGVIFGAPNNVDGGVLVGLPAEVQLAIKSWHESGWCPHGEWEHHRTSPTP